MFGTQTHTFSFNSLCKCEHGGCSRSFVHLIKQNKYFSFRNKCENILKNKPHSFRMTKVFARTLQMLFHTRTVADSGTQWNLISWERERASKKGFSLHLHMFHILEGKPTKNELFLFAFGFFDILVQPMCCYVEMKSRWATNWTCLLRMLCVNSFI